MQKRQDWDDKAYYDAMIIMCMSPSSLGNCTIIIIIIL